MTEKYSIADRFVDTMTELQTIPKYELSDPFRHIVAALRSEAIGGIEDALIRANRLADQAKRIKEVFDEATAQANTEHLADIGMAGDAESAS